ncbi:hypothetical protein [Planomonospora sp. ID91781]|uniref:hypothetical protein n=1 Tax=Planomonospora sp. ID91781 TaxID=2738135 RepID=UPI0018C3CB25|nr:hypothetical protein [Planomonospora sp. ID91781]
MSRIQIRGRRLTVAAALGLLAAGLLATPAAAHPGGKGHPDGKGHRHAAEHDGIRSPRGDARPSAFDLVRTSVRRDGRHLVFTEQVRGRAGSVRPERHGSFAGSEVLSYVWPTSLDPSAVGFTAGSGTLALAATSHPDFDDTPGYDEDRNGRTDDDGARWHSHWVVLVPDTTRPDGALKVRDIAEGEKPDLPRTWPGVPLYLDSPPYPTRLDAHTVRIRVPLADLGFPKDFAYDGVTAALRINADLHDPLLRVSNVLDVASGDLSLPGRVGRG